MKYYTRQTLLQKIKDVYSEDSWNEFVEIYRPYIYHVIKTFGVKAHEIEDHVQTTLIVCWQKLPEFQYEPDKGRFRYWLSRIAKYTVSNHSRKYRRRAELDQEIEIPTSLSPEIEEISDREWKMFISKMAWDNIKDDLTENARLSFSALMEGESVESIAEHLSMPKNTISVNKKRIAPKMIKEIQRLQRELG